MLSFYANNGKLWAWESVFEFRAEEQLVAPVFNGTILGSDISIAWKLFGKFGKIRGFVCGCVVVESKLKQAPSFSTSQSSWLVPAIGIHKRLSLRWTSSRIFVVSILIRGMIW